jgi:hypothetical protein
MTISKELAEKEFVEWYRKRTKCSGIAPIVKDSWNAAIEFVNRELGKRKCEKCCHLVENNVCSDPQNIKFVCLNFKQSELADGSKNE